MFGILFAVVFMMIPSLRESGDEFIQNIPFYVDEIGCWWADTVHFAAKQEGKLCFDIYQFEA